MRTDGWESELLAQELQSITDDVAGMERLAWIPKQWCIRGFSFGVKEEDFAQCIGNLKSSLRIARFAKRNPQNPAFVVEIADHSHEGFGGSESEENLHQDRGRSGIDGKSNT